MNDYLTTAVDYVDAAERQLRLQRQNQLSHAHKARRADDRRLRKPVANVDGGWALIPELSPLEPTETGGVYAMGASNGLIKIGRTWNFRHRLLSLRRSSPLPLVLLAVLSGAQDDERDFHAEFSEHRVHGEWFSPHASLIAAIRDARRIW